jgi:uncharacterized protein YndB with AHSA1/START domain
MSVDQAAPTQVYRIFIRAAAEDIWRAITSPGFTARYFHGARITVAADRYTSLSPTGESWGDEDVYEYDPPRKLVHGWRSLYSEELAAEPASRVTWEIEPHDDSVCLLTVTHDRLAGSPKTAASVGGAGWTYVLSGLKTLLETDRPLFDELR